MLWRDYEGKILFKKRKSFVKVALLFFKWISLSYNRQVRINQNLKLFPIFSVTLIFVFFFRFTVTIQYMFTKADGIPSMLTSLFSLPSNATDNRHFLKELITESFIFPTLDHTSPTHFVIGTLHWLAFILPSTYWSRFSSKWSPNKERTSSLNCLFINTLTTWTRDVHLGRTLTRDVLCFFKSYFTLSVCCAQRASAIRIFRSEFSPILFLKWIAYSVEVHCFIIFRSRRAFSWYMNLIRRSTFFFSTNSKAFASKNNSWSYSVNPISNYCQLNSRLSLV